MDLAVLIAAEIEWKPLGDCSKVLEQEIDMKTDFQVSLDVEITLTRRYLPKPSAEQDIEEVLHDAAFRPKTFKVELAKGRFALADWLWWEGNCSPPKDSDSWFGLRIVFDRSPYPPLEEWLEDRATWRAAVGNDFCGYRDFYRNTEESVYRGPDEKTRAERRREGLERLRRRPSSFHGEQGASASSLK